MADIDYIINTENGFEVSLTDNPTAATGNKALSNRFTITFLTNARQYLLGDTVVLDGYAGDSLKYIGKPQALNNVQSIATSITVAMNKTIDSIKSNQSTVTDPTEKLNTATLQDVYINNGVVYATIEIIPVAYSSSSELYFTLPVRSI
jgi:hypothetical protein